MTEQGAGRAIELRHRDDVAAHVREIENCVVQCRLTAAHAECTDATFQLRNPLFEHARGRVTDAAVAMTLDFKIEERSAVLGAVECISDGLIDRDGNGPMSSLRIIATVHRDGFRPHCICLGFLHAAPLCVRPNRLAIPQGPQQTLSQVPGCLIRHLADVINWLTPRTVPGAAPFVGAATTKLNH